MDEDEERIARLETAMAEMAAAMAETRADIVRLYQAWPEQMRVVSATAEAVRRRSGESDAAMVNELRRIHDRLTAIEGRLSG